MTGTHQYEVTLRWTGNLGTGTSGYREYGRAHEIVADDKPVLHGTSDPAFRGDPGRWTPEELLIASLAQCHMLWYLHLAATAGVVVVDYSDRPAGTMRVEPDGGGRFTQVALRPEVIVAEESMLRRTAALHEEANAKCFIARSMAFPVLHEPTARVVEPAPRLVAGSG